MRNLLFTAVMMARKDRHGGGGSTETDSQTTQEGADVSTLQTGAETGPTTDAPVNGETVNVKVDTDGVVHGEGYDASTDIDTDVVALPKKIVAKDIVGRAALKCTKKWIPEKHPQTGEQMLDGDGNPKGTWEVTPPTPLYTVFGTANGTETGETTYGAWVGFQGDFEAVRTADAKRFKSNRLILQEPAQTLLLGALGRIKKIDPAGSVSFAFNVGKRTSQRWVDSNEGTTYEYTIESVVNVVKHDPLAHLRKALLPHLPKPPNAQLTGPQGGTPQS